MSVHSTVHSTASEIHQPSCTLPFSRLGAGRSNNAARAVATAARQGTGAPARADNNPRPIVSAATLSFVVGCVQCLDGAIRALCVMYSIGVIDVRPEGPGWWNACFLSDADASRVHMRHGPVPPPWRASPCPDGSAVIIPASGDSQYQCVSPPAPPAPTAHI